MEDVERLLKAAIEEIERVLSSKSVVGDPITVEGTTIVPLVNIGFGFGAGGGAGRSPKEKRGEGSGGITGGGGGIKPVAIVVINQEGVRLEPVKTGTASLIEKVVDVIGRTRQKREPEKTE